METVYKRWLTLGIFIGFTVLAAIRCWGPEELEGEPSGASEPLRRAESQSGTDRP